jgi:hypothetical protein
MHVQMKHRLAGARTHIQHGTISVLDIALAGNLGGGQVALANHFGVFRLRFLQSGKMPFGNDQDMRGGLRLKVVESEDMIVLENLPRGNFAAQNAAEEAVCGFVGHGMNLVGR